MGPLSSPADERDCLRALANWTIQCRRMRLMSGFWDKEGKTSAWVKYHVGGLLAMSDHVEHVKVLSAY